MACGLAVLGVNRGDKVVICGDNRPHLYWSMTAVQVPGGIPVPVYQDSVPDEMQYIYEHAEARYAIVENQEQVDKLLEIKDRAPALEHIVYKFPRGMRHYNQPFLSLLTDVQEQGRAYNKENPSFYEDCIAASTGSDIAIMLYTSGTTGRPNGVILSFDNLIIAGRNGAIREGLREDDDMLAYLPMAWIGGNIFPSPRLMSPGSASVVRKVWKRCSTICAKSARPISLRRRASTKAC